VNAMDARIRGAVLALGLAAGLSAVAPGMGMAQEFPARPIEFVVPWGPGGGADQVARKLAKLMEPALKVSMPVVNVPGATGQTGLTKMLTAPPDGYSISVFIGDTFAIQAGTPPPKWTMKDIKALGVVIQQPSAFLVAESGKFKSWADVEKIAKTETVRVAMLGFGSADDLTINYYVKKKGLKLVAVPFSKPGERYSAVLGGHADILYEQIGDVRNFVDNKQMKPVLVFAEKRDANFKDVPTSVELGDKVTLPQFRSIVVRGGTDAKIVKKLSEALAAAANDPEYVEYLKSQYADPNSFVAGDKADAFFAGELKAMKALAAQVGMTKAEAPAEAKKN
jgi:tripartite-type tricarboxylate transporter receptor subunit TctC